MGLIVNWSLVIGHWLGYSTHRSFNHSFSINHTPPLSSWLVEGNAIILSLTPPLSSNAYRRPFYHFITHASTVTLSLSKGIQSLSHTPPLSSWACRRAFNHSPILLHCHPELLEGHAIILSLTPPLSPWACRRECYHFLSYNHSKYQDVHWINI